MEAATSLVIKVKYGNMLRRFNALVVDTELEFNMSKLMDKVFSLFKFSPETDLILTYIDEDGDMVNLIDDHDLHCAINQALNPLRITVKQNDRKESTLTPLRSPRLQQSTRDTVSIPEPLHETLMKLSTELVSKVSASAPGIAPVANDLINYFSKLGLSYIDQIQEFQTRVQPGAKNDVPESSSTAAETKDSEVTKADKVPSNGGPESSTKNNELKVSNVSEATLETRSSKDSGFNVVAPGLDSKNVIVDLHNKYNSPDSAFRIGKKETSKKIIDSRHFGKSGESSNGCGVLPITGPRSKVKMNYELCSLCFEQMGIDDEYSRMDGPGITDCCPFRGLKDIQVRYQIPTGRNFHSMTNGILDCCVIKDVNIPFGTVMAPSTQFTKIWRLRNCGTAVWPKGTKLVFLYGDIMNYADSVELEIPAAGLAVDQEIDVAVDFISPERPGGHCSNWEMAKPCGQKFGPLISIDIKVDDAIQQSPHVGPGSWNLNLSPPPNSVLSGPEIRK